jgi:Spy/CpxP family protein refolding chaperone
MWRGVLLKKTRIMKNLMLAVMMVAGSLISVAGYSQDKQMDPEARAKKVTEKMKTELSLSDDQYTKVYDINLKYGGKMHDLRKQDGDRQSKMNEIRDLNKAKNDELKAVLSKEQMDKYQEMKKDARHKMRDRRKKSA